MSTLVKNNNALVFGSQNPFKNYLTEPGIKNAFLHKLLDTSSKIYRNRSWKVYCLVNKIFPNKTVEINNNIRYSLGKIIDPFLTTNINQIEQLMLNVNKSKYVQGEIELNNTLIKLTGIKNTLVMVVDNEKELTGSRHGVITYLTRNLSNGSCDYLEASWSDGFFKFNDPANLCMVTVIPKQYLATVIQNVSAASTKELNSVTLDKLALKGRILDEICVDLTKSIFTSIYSDGIRARVNSDILLYNSLIQKEGSIISTTTQDMYESSKACDTFKKYSSSLKQFKESKNDEHLVYSLLECSDYEGAKLNPLDFYTSFIDTPYVHMENTFSKCGAYQRLSGDMIGGDYIYSNNLKEMDIFDVDNDRDIVIYGLKLLRYLPFVLFNTYVVGSGSAHIQTKQLIENIKKIMPSILGYAASNYWTSNVIKFIINNMNYLIDTLYVELSSPMTTNNKSKQALLTAIDKYGVKEDEDIDDGTINGVVLQSGEKFQSKAALLSDLVKGKNNG